MEGIRRSIYRLTVLGCLFAGAFLPLPGDGQNLPSALPTVVPHLGLPHSEAGNLSVWTTAPAVTSADGSPTITSQVNASTSSPPEPAVPATFASLNITVEPQNTDHASNSSVDTASHRTPAANQSSLDDVESASTVSWATPSTTFTTTEPFQSKETRGPTATSHTDSSIFSTLGPTEGRPEIRPEMEHEVTTENMTESTSAEGAVVTDRRVPTLEGFTTTTTTTTLTPEAVSTLSSHSTAPVETEQAANHVQEKTPDSDIEGYGEDQPNMPTASSAGEDPLVIAVIFIFIMTVGILAFMGFLRYRQRSSRLQFRRLQDLPMDDMMEETPLSLYSY